MIKAKTYDWKDSNVALFGSDEDRKVKKDAAETEAAWEGAGSKVGLTIWRIVQFKVAEWPQKDYGKFFEGDSYIILNTYKIEGEDELKYDVHFWIGKYSTQDEYGTAAYKTVELDTLLDDKAIQHREVMKNESNLFKSYFKALTYLKGGAETGFRHVEPKSYAPRLFQYNQVGKNMIVKEVSLCRESLTSTDVFVLDMGLRIIQWNGTSSAGKERYSAAKYIQDTESERNTRIETEVIDETSEDDTSDFYNSLTGEMEVEDEEFIDDSEVETICYKLSDTSGQMQLDTVKTGSVTNEDLNPEDVFFIDTGKCLLVWIGSQASIEERRNALGRAHGLLQNSKHPLIHIAVYSENDARFWKELSS